MADSSGGFNLDSLLEDLNQATRGDVEPATIKFVPHRPTKEKSPSQTNPKARFAVNPEVGSGFSNPPSPHSPVTNSASLQSRITPAKDSNSNMKEPSSFDKEDAQSPSDEYNIDNLLDMLASPAGENSSMSNNRSRSNSYSKPSTITPVKVTAAVDDSSTSSIFSKSTGGLSYGRDRDALPSTVVAPQRLNFSNGGSSSSSTVAPSTGTSSSSSSGSGNTSLFPSTSASSRISSSINSGNSNGTTAPSSSSQSSSSVSSFPSTNANAAGNRKCTKVIIAGASHTRGVKLSAFSKCACDNLRCLQCNFRVHTFPNKSWSSTGVDYMFFRNNVPNESKLETGLVRNEEGGYAYCCQCSWTNAMVEKVLLSGGGGPDPQWVCAGHS